MPAIIFYLLATSLACIAMAFLPEIALIPAIAWGAFLIIAALHLEDNKILAIFFINLLLLLFMAGVDQLFVYFVFFGIAAVIMSLLASRNWDYYKIQKAGVSVAVLGVSVFLLWTYLASGGIGINELESQLNQAAAESIKIYEDMGIFENQLGISLEEFQSSLQRTTAAFARHLPAIYYLQAIIAVFFMLLLAAHTAQKANYERLKKKAFREEMMPWQLVWIAIAGLGLWIWGRDELNQIYYLGSNILWTVAPIAVYYGLALVGYQIGKARSAPRVFFIFGLILLILALPLSAILFLSIIGLFDSLVDFRKLRRGQEE